MDADALRSEFPVLARVAYLNAGTDGPLARAAVEAASAELERELADGRAAAHFARRKELGTQLRAAYAALLGCEASDVALTTSTTEGMAQVIAGLEIGPGDEILTSDEEHPGLLGQLAAAQELRGASIRLVPLAEVHEAVGPRTRLVACSHVSWATGALAPAELADVDVPVLLDGAQGLGAVPIDVAALGCDAYAAAGQKWLCGPDGTGVLYVGPELLERIAVSRRGFSTLAQPNAGLDAGLQPDARRLDTFSQGAEAHALALGALAVLERAGWPAVFERARTLAARLATALGEIGRDAVERGDTTLVSFPSPDAERERGVLAEAGVVVRNIPGRPWLRASVGAWNDEHDLDRLLTTLSR